MNQLPTTIAIDGPAASGKTTVGLLLAKKLGYLCLDTGVFYRALTAEAISSKLDPLDEEAITEMAYAAQIKVAAPSRCGQELSVLVNEHDLSTKLRTSRVNRWVSEVSAYPGVRLAILNLQRQVGEQGKIILLGRDIGSVVLPNAACKIYLTASAEERAKRRFQEESAMGSGLSCAEILESIRHRDELDSSRTTAPLKAADDAYILNTDGLNPEEVVAEILKYIQFSCPEIQVPDPD